MHLFTYNKGKILALRPSLWKYLYTNRHKTTRVISNNNQNDKTHWQVRKRN